MGQPTPETDAIGRAFVSVIDESIRREIAAEDLVRAEIKAKGTYWAGAEIYQLRRRVAALQKAAADREQRR